MRRAISLSTNWGLDFGNPQVVMKLWRPRRLTKDFLRAARHDPNERGGSGRSMARRAKLSAARAGNNALAGCARCIVQPPSGLETLQGRTFIDALDVLQRTASAPTPTSDFAAARMISVHGRIKQRDDDVVGRRRVLTD